MKKIILIGLLLSHGWAHGQQAISLDEAIQTTLQKNQLLQSASLQIDYYRQLKSAATDVGKLSATWMHGQYNSLYQDNNYTLNQTIPFPTQLSSQVRLGQAQVAGSEMNLKVAQNELILDVKSTYYQLLYQTELRNLLLMQDTLFEDFAKASSLRYKTGESNLLEKTTAETQWLEAKNQFRINQADIQISQSHLQSLLRSDNPVAASDVLRKRDVPLELDTLSLSSNPQLGYLKQQQVISRRVKSVEKNRILPDISVGYFSQSLIGIQNINGQDRYFGKSKSFQGFQFGLAVPLWIAPHLARARAAGFNEAAARKNADHFQTTLLSTYAQARQELEKNQGSLTYYEESALGNAALILNQARRAFSSGQIGYLEYLQSLKNVITIRTGYLLALNHYNQSVIRLEYLIGKF